MGRTRASIGPRLVTRSADLRTHLLGFGISAQPTTPFRSILDHYAATPKARKKESTYYSRTSKCKVNIQRTPTRHPISLSLKVSPSEESNADGKPNEQDTSEMQNSQRN